MLDRGPLLAREIESGEQHILVRRIAHIREELIRSRANDRWLAVSRAGDNREVSMRDLTIRDGDGAGVAILSSDGVIKRKREFVLAKANRFIARQIRPEMN